MSEIRYLDGTLWKGFRTENDSDQRFFYTNANKKNIILKSKPYFNKNTDSVIIYKGFETTINSYIPLSEEIIYIGIDYHISNYFGDKSGMHFRHKEYVLIDGSIFQQYNDKVKKVIKLSKELKGILTDINKNYNFFDNNGVMKL